MDAAPTARRYAIAVVVPGAVVALLGWAFFDGGGSGTASTAGLGTAAVILAAAMLLAWLCGGIRLPQLDRASALTAAAAIALVAWSGLTVWWSIAGDRSWDALAKGIVLLAFGVVGLVASACPGKPVRVLAFLLAALVGAVLVWSLAGKVVPALGPDDASRVARLKGPIGYWNALALVGDAALGLGIWLAVSVSSRLGRAVGALLLFAAVVVLVLTQSRAGVLAGIVVVVLALWLSEQRVEAGLFGLLAVGPALVVSGWALSRAALVADGGTHAARTSDGVAFGVLAVLGAAAAVVLVLVVPVGRLVATRRREIVRALVGVGALTLVLGALGLVVAVGNPARWVADQVTSSGEVTNGACHVCSLESNNRTVWWGEAWQIFRAHPGAGTGARTFEIARKRVRASASNVTEPHSVPLQLLSDTGAPGFVLGLVLVAGLAIGLRAAIGRLDTDERAAAVALLALPVAFGLHALVDYDLDYLAVAAPTTLVSAALLGAGRRVREPRTRLLGGAGVVAFAGVAIWVVVAPALSARLVDQSLRQADAGKLGVAASTARRAQSLNPLSPDALVARATVAGLAGDNRGAERYYEQATKLQPENPATWYDLGIFRYIAGDLCGAYTALNAAYTLDPKSSLFAPGGALDRARDAVNDPNRPACGR